MSEITETDDIMQRVITFQLPLSQATILLAALAAVMPTANDENLTEMRDGYAAIMQGIAQDKAEYDLEQVQFDTGVVH